MIVLQTASCCSLYFGVLLDRFFLVASIHYTILLWQAENAHCHYRGNHQFAEFSRKADNAPIWIYGI